MVGVVATLVAAASSTCVAAEHLAAPAGRYTVDPNHSNLQFSVQHMGLSNYVARFTRYEVDLDLDAAGLENSSVAVRVDATSVRTDYAGDYKATHPDSAFDSWDEDLAFNEEFFAAHTHPRIEFQSTAVTVSEAGQLQVTGNLTLLGVTRPVTLDATIVGSTAQHPLARVGAIGISARTQFQRSDFGMDYLLRPPLLGDTVTLQFEGELLQEKVSGQSP